MALGTDSPITAQGDLLDELRFLADTHGLREACLRNLVTTAASEILRLPPRPEDWIAAPAFGSPPELVVIGGSIRLISPQLAAELPKGLRQNFALLRTDGRPEVFVRWNIPQLLQDTRDVLGSAAIRLGGREISG
jgi:hypothetical protein